MKIQTGKPIRKFYREHTVINKGQTILEYLFVILLVVAALTVMQLYMKRGMQAVIKVAADELAAQVNSEQVVDPVKGGYLYKGDSSQKFSRNLRAKEAATGAMNYATNERTETSSDSIYAVGKIQGEFEAPE